MKAKTGAGDPLVVLTSELAAVLQRVVDTHEAEHPHSLGSEQRGIADGGVFSVGPMGWISQESGIPVRTLHRILRCESKTTSLQLADQVLAGIGMNHVFDTEVHVIPNPHWNLERWQNYMDERGCRR